MKTDHRRHPGTMTLSSATMVTTAGRQKQKKASPKGLSHLKLTRCFSTLNSHRNNRDSPRATRTEILINMATLLPKDQPSTRQNRLTRKLSRLMVIITLITSNFMQHRPKQRACLPRSTSTNTTRRTHSTRNTMNSTTTTQRLASRTSKRDTHIISSLIRAHSTQQAQGRSVTKANDGDASGAEPKDENEVT